MVCWSYHFNGVGTVLTSINVAPKWLTNNVGLASTVTRIRNRTYKLLINGKVTTFVYNTRQNITHMWALLKARCKRSCGQIAQTGNQVWVFWKVTLLPCDRVAVKKQWGHFRRPLSRWFGHQDWRLKMGLGDMWSQGISRRDLEIWVERDTFWVLIDLFHKSWNAAPPFPPRHH